MRGRDNALRGVVRPSPAPPAHRDGRNQNPEALGVATREPFAAIYR